MLWKLPSLGRPSPCASEESDPRSLEAGLTCPQKSEPLVSQASKDVGAASSTTTCNDDEVHAEADFWPQSEHDLPPKEADQSHLKDMRTPEICENVQNPSAANPAGRKSQLLRKLRWPGTSKSAESMGPSRHEKLEGTEKCKESERPSKPSSKYPDLTAQLAAEYTEEAVHAVQSYAIGNNGSAHTSPAQQHQDKYKPSIFGAILSSKFNSLRHDDYRQSYPLNHDQPSEWLDVAGRQTQSKHKHHYSYSSRPSSRGSGSNTPRSKIKWYEKPEYSNSVASLLAHRGMSMTGPGTPSISGVLPGRKYPSKSPKLISTAVAVLRDGDSNRVKRYSHKTNEDHNVVAEVADIIARRRYLSKLCDVLMQYGAPTHRAEAYLQASASALLIDAQFMYLPGAMMCTFIDHTLQSNSVELVRKVEGLDFGRLKDVFEVYKCVIHEKFTAEEAIVELETIRRRSDPYSDWFRIFIFGLASVVVGPFSFNSRPIDFGPIFVLGCALGFLQLKVVPQSTHFSNVFEVSACVLVAFIARALGSIRSSDGSYMFCFSATAQSSISMILPGFMVLNAALELQGRNIVAGSVRMVYAIIYVLFLGFGLLVGTTIFGLIKRDATEDVTCRVPEWFLPGGATWKLIYTRFIWAPLFACCVAIIYRAKWRQLPVMAFIAVCGYQANFWISTQLSSNLQVANAVGAFVIGCLANLYSRMFHGMAAAAMLPAIYCQVPGGLAASGSLVAGVQSSNQILGNSSSVSVINNGTSGFVAAQSDPSAVYGGTIYNVGYGMVQVAIGISVGLYLSALVIYPYGKRRSALFSF